MLLVARRTTARLAFAKPLGHCCNCGCDGDVALVETPLQQTRLNAAYRALCVRANADCVTAGVLQAHTAS